MDLRLVKREALPDVDVGFAFLRNTGPKVTRRSAAAVLAYGRNTLRLGRIVAITLPTTRTIAVLEKIGLRLEGTSNCEDGVQLMLFGPPVHRVRRFARQRMRAL